MKTLDQIKDKIMSMMAKGFAPTGLFQPKARKRITGKPNPFRRAHKPLYGGMAHRDFPIGQRKSFTQDQVRHIEIVLGAKVRVDWQGIYVGKHRIGNLGDTVPQVIINAWEQVPNEQIPAMTTIPGENKFRESIMHRYSLATDPADTNFLRQCGVSV